VCLTAAELYDVQTAMPKAVRNVFWRITIFYIGGILIVGLLVPYTNPNLLGNASPISQSPFVIAIQSAGINGLPSVMNGIVLVTVLSVANSSVYGSTRTIGALALHGQAPSAFKYVDTWGRPMVANAVALGFGLLAFLAQLKSQKAVTKVFDWLLAISGNSVIITWTSMCVAHIQFRRAWRHQNKDLNDLPFRSDYGTTGSWIGLFMNLAILVMNLVTAILPIGYKTMSGGDRFLSFMQSFMSVPLVIIFYVVYKWKYKTVIKRPRMTPEAHATCDICAVDLNLPYTPPGAMLSYVNQRCHFVDLNPPPLADYTPVENGDAQQGVVQGEEAAVDNGAAGSITVSEVYRLSKAELAIKDGYVLVRNFFRFPWA